MADNTTDGTNAPIGDITKEIIEKLVDAAFERINKEIYDNELEEIINNELEQRL